MYRLYENRLSYTVLTQLLTYHLPSRGTVTLSKKRKALAPEMGLMFKFTRNHVRNMSLSVESYVSRLVL